MDWLLVILQGLFGVVVFTVPGLALIVLVSGRKMPGWPFAFLLAASFVVSSLVVAGLQYVSLTLLSPLASRIVTWAFALVALVYLLWRGRKLLAEAFSRLGPWERRSLLALAAVVTFWLLAMPLSPYPGQVTMSLGDPPVYYRAATNLAAGKGWTPDYFAADYAGGRVRYIEAHPIPVLVATPFCQAFGANWYAIHIHGMIAAGLLLCLLVSFVRANSTAPADDGLHVLLLTLALALLPAHFVLFGLGAITAPGGLALLTAVAFSTAGVVRGRLRYWIIGASLVLMLGLRPEAALVAVLLAAAYLVRWLFARSRGRWFIRIGVPLAGVALSVAVWWHLPALMDAFPTTWQDLAVNGLRFDAASGRFVPMHVPFWELNRGLCRANFAGDGAVERLRNAAIGSELRAHPAAFLSYVLGEIPGLARSFVRAVSVAQYQLRWLDGAPSVAILAALLALASLSRGGKCFVAAVAAFLLVLPAVNRGAHVRHMLTASPIVIALVLRSAWERWGHALERVGSNRWLALAAVPAALALAFLDCRSIIRIRTYAPNRSYANMLRDIEAKTSRHDVVASSYPQLVACMTGRGSIGGTWLTENLDLIVQAHRPDAILIDDTNDVARNYELLMQRGGRIPGYEAILHDPGERYILFRRATRHRTSRPDP